MQSPSDGGSNNPPHAPTNDAPGPSPQSQWPRWVHVVFFTFVVHLVMDLWCTCGLWWTCKLIWMDLSTYYYILWWMCYGRMDVWMDEIYMWWIRYICDICLYECICHDGTQKKNYLPFWVTLPSVALGKGPLCRAQWSKHSAKLAKWATRKQIFQLCRVLWL